MTKKAFLLILDGWGHGPKPESSAIAAANTSYIDSLYKDHPNAELITYGTEVGLPEGQMGNSEVGHLNIGAGRIVYQELERINQEIKSGKLKENKVLVEALTAAKTGNKKVHLIGLLSDGGVHSHINHLKELCNITQDYQLANVNIHAFLDGRDTSPKGGKQYVKEILDHIENTDIKLASMIGRYYAMDRDLRWERIKLAYDLLVRGESKVTTDDPIAAIQKQYDNNITDEFLEPIVISTDGSISNGDLVIFFNFRTDRPRQLTRVLTQEDFPDFEMKKLDLSYLTMSRYDSSFQSIDVLYEKDNINQTIGQVVSEKGLKQLRIAESEKYPHVTFFLSGGREDVFDNEHRILIDSPKVATYDLQPEMSAYVITNAVSQYIVKEAPDLIVLNYANADMVGHTGDFNAAIEAAEDLDSCLECLIPIALRNEYKIMIIADHGNSDYMINDDGTAHTAHTTNPVPIIIIDPDNDIKTVKNGKLADVAPTLLKMMGVDIPAEMTGDILVS